MSNHLVAIFGGAVSGAEAAYQFIQRNIPCVVFDQNTLPYGKIEDGLPKWHNKLRDQEEEKINEKLSHELVRFVPHIRLGREISFEELVNWGFSAVILAIGAWRDRPLPIEGIDDYVDKGLIYQNSFIYWFNHFHEPNYNGPQFEALDNTIVVGGGLASLDVLKVLMILTVQRALKEKGHEVNMFQLDRSIAKVLDQLGYTLEDLGLKGATLYYRRRIKDMPLSPTQADSPEKMEKVRMIQEKILNNYQSKYLFNVKPLHAAVDKIVENGRLVGLAFKQTELVDERIVPIAGPETFVWASQVISSIGSIPQLIKGIPANGQVFDINENNCCQLEGYPNVFAVGNTVTGRGNIKDSMKHSQIVTKEWIDTYLDTELSGAVYGDAFETRALDTAEQVESIANKISHSPSLSDEKLNELHERVSELQQLSGYEGDFRAWVKTHLPVRLEDLLGETH
ncbi:MAG: hypothetical protein R3E32_17060 [Chitinophagales bacterium]